MKNTSKIEQRTKEGFSHILAIVVAALISLAAVPHAAASWNQFGSNPGNTNRIRLVGPYLGVGSTTQLTPTLGGSIGPEVGVIIDEDGDYILSSYEPYIHVFDSVGVHLGMCDLTAHSISEGCRAVPYYDNTRNLILTGTESGTFLEIEVDKSTTPYTFTVTQDTSVGTIESSPVMAGDGTLYVAGQWATIYRYSCQPLTQVSSIDLPGVVTGGIALFNCDASSPGDEVIVATQDGELYVLSHDLSAILGVNTDGAHYFGVNNEYYGGVTIANRTSYGLDPIAVLGVTGGISYPVGPYAGQVWAINLNTLALEWQLTPSNTTVGGSDQIEGSIAILHEGTSWFVAVASSTDGYVYGIDLLTGTELWSYGMGAPGHAAPAVGRFNGVYLVDGCETLHVLNGPTGTLSYMDTSMFVGGTDEIGKVAIGFGRKLGVGVGSSAYVLSL